MTIRRRRCLSDIRPYFFSSRSRDDLIELQSSSIMQSGFNICAVRAEVDHAREESEDVFRLKISIPLRKCLMIATRESLEATQCLYLAVGCIALILQSLSLQL